MQDNIEYDLYAALVELVELKDMKDKFSGRETPDEFMSNVYLESEYEQRKPLAWEAARKAIQAYEEDNN